VFSYEKYGIGANFILFAIQLFVMSRTAFCCFVSKQKENTTEKKQEKF